MADAVYAIPHFGGGEVSHFAQGRFDRPDYRVSLNVCLNAFPGEMGTWMRRPGTMFAGTTRGGAAGRVVKFDFEQAVPYTLEFTDSKLRFRNGASLAITDTQTITSISAANPAVVQLAAAVTWATGDTLIFSAPSAPLLENRQFLGTKIDTTHFSLTDALTGATINGATLGTLAAGATVSRVQELSTAYVGGIWSGLRAVQAETTAVLLQSVVPPQALTVSTLPTATTGATFAINPALFQDGPYLDPFTNGVQLTPGSTTGVVQMTISFPAYSATTSYPVGVFVTSGSVNYKSLIDQNVGNTPASSPSAWQATSAAAAINNGQGILGTDVGRLVRLFSEPPLWLITTAYTAGNVVSYNPSGQPGATTYWQCQTGNTGKAPGTDLTNWQIVAQGAVWSWGRIANLSTAISGTLAGSLNIGTLTGGGGLAAAFNGSLSQDSTTAANFSISSSGGATVAVSGFVGKNYTGASAQKIASATYFTATDLGYNHAFVTGTATPNLIIVNLRASQTAPATSSDGTLLGSTSLTANSTIAVSVTSNDQNTAWNYVWFEQISEWNIGPFPNGTYRIYCGQAEFFAPAGTGVSNGFGVEILGPALLYTSPIRTWRMGLYSATTGYPTCGSWYEGRLWLAGAVANRFDASVSNGITGNTINMAPTDQYGVVAASNAISETLNSDSVNPIFWMEPDLQGLIMGTQAGEYLVVAPTTGPIAPNNIAARRVTKIGCANVEPRRTEHTSVFAQRYGRKLMEYFPDVFSGKFTAPNIADKAEHIVRNGIAELAYVSAVTPIIWARDALFSFFGVTYKRDTLTTSQGPTYAAWHRHSLGSGRGVESLCAGPSTDGNLDALTMVTNDPATNVRHVEILTDAMNELSPLSAAWFLDDAVNPTSTSTDGVNLTLNGLWHLNGKTVQVFAAGLDLGDRGPGTTGYTDFAVTNGSLVIPFADGISAGPGAGLFTADFFNSITLAQVVVGFTYNSDGQLVRPIAQADTGARNGPALGKTRRNHQYSILLSNTRGISVGGTFDVLRPVPLKMPDDTTDIPVLSMYSGVIHGVLDDNYSYDGMVAWRVSRPMPANVVAFSGFIATQDR